MVAASVILDLERLASAEQLDLNYITQSLASRSQDERRALPTREPAPENQDEVLENQPGNQVEQYAIAIAEPVVGRKS